MVFSSTMFLFIFLPVTLVLYYILPKACKNVVLLLCSLVFYAWGEPVYVILMIFSIVFNYVSGLDLAAHMDDKGKAKRSLLFAVAVNLCILGFFKYYGFFIDNLNAVLPFHISYQKLGLPIGISFYTFQTLSYLIDVYKGDVKVQNNLVHFGVYVSMFPQLIAGPIVRYADIERQLTERQESFEKFGHGVLIFIRGLSKKVLLADTIALVFSEVSGWKELSVLSAWLGCAAFTFQIYFDFSGYSDMAIGLGKMFGFDLLKNFEHPYMAKSITEFWRRWHISLGTWFREYVYIPLGGNREGMLKHIRNIFIVWFLTGLWHGASWNFIIWGLYYGMILLIEKVLLARVLERTPVLVRHVYSMLLIMIGWVFFFSPGLGASISYLGAMFGTGSRPLADAQAIYLLWSNLPLWVTLCLCSTSWVYSKWKKFIYQRPVRIKLHCITYGILFLLCIAYLVTETYSPFLYFRF